MALLPDKNKRYTWVIIIIILFSSASIILLNYFSIKILSSIRAYVNGESQYSKAQKDATSYLINYLDSPDDFYFNNFKKELSVPIGDSIARVAMQQNAGFKIVEKGFLQARNHKDDIENLNWLFVNFQHVPFFKRAIKEWATADQYIGKLDLIGDAAFKGYQNNDLPYEARQKFLRQIDILNSKLTLHQQQFSNILGEASRLITGILIYVNVTFILLILISVGLFTKKLIRELLISQLEVEKQNYAKDEFLSIASHELKTPITSLKASLQILERLTAKTTELHSIHPFIINSGKQVKRLTELVNELLDVTKINSGKLLLQKKMFALHHMVRETVDEISTLSAHEFIIKNLPETYVLADQNRIHQVLVNLLTNAAKYSKPTSQILINLENGVNEVTICVKDFGSGIPKDKILFLFERFYRIEETENVAQGLGLGLFISNEIIKNHNGTMGVTSNLGEGSEFWFKIPKA